MSFQERIDPKRFDIWRYASFYQPPVDEAHRLTLGEGWTKELALWEDPSLSPRIRGEESGEGLRTLFLKREDLNPLGSHKARSLAYQISRLWAEGKKVALIPSSGNAAVAAAAYCLLAGMRLLAFVPPQIAPFKLAQLRRFGAEVIITSRAINAAKQVANKYGLVNLRPSTNELSIEGFKSIAFEIYEKLGDADAIFTFVTSASSLVGIGRAFRILRDEFGVRMPQLHAVQAGQITSIAGHFDRAPQPSGRSIVGDLGVKMTRRTEEAIALIEESGGSGWVVSDEEIRASFAWLNRRGIDTSPEGAAALAGTFKAARKLSLGRAVCLLTGHASGRPLEERETKIEPVDDPREIERIVKRLIT